MPEGAQSLRAIVEIDGTPLAADIEPLVEQVVVDQHVLMPDAFSISFRDHDRKILDKAKAKVGAKVKISATPLGSVAPTLLIVGDVTTLEADYHGRHTVAIIRGYDQSHRMSSGRATRTYKDVTDSDIVRKAASEHGVEIGTIDSSSIRYEHVSQVNVSDWEFVRTRARKIGFDVSVEDGKFNFRKPKQASDAPAEGDYGSPNPLQLVFGEDLLEFRPRITGAGQVPDVQVRSWDYQKKEHVEGSSRADTTSVKLKDSGPALAAKFSAPKLFVVNQPNRSAEEVSTAAKAIGDDVGSTWAEADGVARGNPKLRAGVPITVSVVAEPFAGNYTLTRTRHVFDDEGYRTEIVVSGRNERSLLGLTTFGATAMPQRSHQQINGVVTAIVTDINDPDKLGRVRLKFPWLADDYESNWVRFAQLGAGPDSGATFLADVQDEVLVAFEHGDLNHPIIIGNLYNGKDKPKLDGDFLDTGKGAMKQRTFTSRKGHRIVFYDHDSKTGIAIETKDGRMQVLLDETSGEIRIQAKDKKIVVEAASDISLKANGNVSIEGQGGVSIKSSAVVEVSGSMIKLN